ARDGARQAHQRARGGEGGRGGPGQGSAPRPRQAYRGGRGGRGRGGVTARLADRLSEISKGPAAAPGLLSVRGGQRLCACTAGGARWSGPFSECSAMERYTQATPARFTSPAIN